LLGELLEIVATRPAPEDDSLWSQFDCQVVNATPGAQTNALFQVLLQLQICFGHVPLAPGIPNLPRRDEPAAMAANDV
jgi:hypothetical protein